MDHYGFLSLVPAICVILFALKTRKTFEALLLGSVITYVIIHGIKFFSPWLSTLLDVVGNGDTAWYVITFGLFGVFLALAEESRSSFGFSKLLLKWCTTKRRTMFSTFVIGVVLFIDDYLDSITSGAVMKPISDKNKLPRESLAYVIDSTAAPMCVIVPISTWVVFYSGVFGNESSFAHLGTGMGIYLKSLPWIIYAWVALVIVFLFAMQIVPPIGSMKKAFQRVKETGKVYSDRSKEWNLGDDDKINLDEISTGKSVLNFLAPLGLLILVTIITEDILIGVMASVALQFVLYVPMKVVSFDKYFKTLVKGFQNMLPMIFILIGAFMMQAAAEDIGLANYVIEKLENIMGARVFPAITFLAVSVVSFITGSNWGVPALMVPIVFPLAIAVGANPYLTAAAIVGGGTFSSHICFYSDATVLTSMASGCDNMDHALTQAPYGFIGAGITFVITLVLGFVL